jgi:hypothetical protein
MGVAGEVANAQKETSAAYAAIEPVIEKIQKTVRELNASSTSANLESRAKTALEMQVSLGFIALVVSGFAFGIGRSISRPVTHHRRHRDLAAETGLQCRAPIAAT